MVAATVMGPMNYDEELEYRRRIKDPTFNVPVDEEGINKYGQLCDESEVRIQNCSNGGTCFKVVDVPYRRSLVCRCHNNFTGDLCQRTKGGLIEQTEFQNPDLKMNDVQEPCSKWEDDIIKCRNNGTCSKIQRGMMIPKRRKVVKKDLNLSKLEASKVDELVTSGNAEHPEVCESDGGDVHGLNTSVDPGVNSRDNFRDNPLETSFKTKMKYDETDRDEFWKDMERELKEECRIAACVTKIRKEIDKGNDVPELYVGKIWTQVKPKLCSYRNSRIKPQRNVQKNSSSIFRPMYDVTKRLKLVESISLHDWDDGVKKLKYLKQYQRKRVTTNELELNETNMDISVGISSDCNVENVTYEVSQPAYSSNKKAETDQAKKRNPNDNTKSEAYSKNKSCNLKDNKDILSDWRNEQADLLLSYLEKEILGTDTCEAASTGNFSRSHNLRQRSTIADKNEIGGHKY
ncbi:hypothetical protein HELRODRAFT_174479 [Helobdella robusta]|uniref:EGF-like domain-containing protein n=1 Tax=Helobdella robusta TaxID=6412 RepID=T1F860_HELRO|nr:hypothetical protein HELRODRAFT_174479 [Helobdella robusta]ESO01523.1 hypothetical protein HELRODRAFT_174479 [Helobdella robusta]